MEYAMPRANCVALYGGIGAVLLFPVQARNTGLLLAVLPHAAASSVYRALKYMDEPVLLSPAATNQVAKASDDEEVCEHLRELFFYTDRILCRTPRIGLWTQTLLIANFVGCRMDGSNLPTQELSLTDTDHAKLLAFLICLFLTLRQKDGRLHASCSLPHPNTASYTYRASFAPIPDRKDPTIDLAREATSFAFLSHPLFRHCSIRFVDNRLVMEAILPQKAAEEIPLVRDRKEALCILRIELGA